jgi:tRNA threonylcarbamoyladenosine biosynthesis protein TsaE
MHYMSTVVTWQTSSISSEQTEQLAQRLGKALRGGEVIELVSDLGGGKTTFTRGLARGMGSTDTVASPTFTISKVYQAGDLEIHHFDFYRLQEPGIIADELAEVVGAPHTVVVVEWADAVQSVLPASRLTISMERTPNDSDERALTFTTTEDLFYLIEAAQQ